MNDKNNNGSFIVAFNFSDDQKTGCLIIGIQKPGKQPDVINIFQGQEAYELYLKLLTPTEDMKKVLEDTKHD